MRSASSGIGMRMEVAPDRPASRSRVGWAIGLAIATTVALAVVHHVVAPLVDGGPTWQPGQAETAHRMLVTGMLLVLAGVWHEALGVVSARLARRRLTAAWRIVIIAPFAMGVGLLIGVVLMILAARNDAFFRSRLGAVDDAATIARDVG